MNFKITILALALLLSGSGAFANNSTNPAKCKTPPPPPKTKCVKPTPKPPCPKPTPKPTPPPTPKPVPVVTTTNNSASNSAASSTSSANATGGSSSSKSGVTNSGNSSNTNSNTAQGGQGGSASQTQSNASTNNNASSAANNGNNSNNSVTNIAAPKIPVNTAYAPELLPTVPCFKGVTGGAQTAPVGISFGAGKVDEGCDERQDALTFAAMGSRVAACKIMIANKRARKAGITLEDCLGKTPVAAVVAPPVATVTPAVTTEVAVAPPIIEAVEAPESPLIELASCEFKTGVVTNVCKQLLDTAVLYYKHATGGYLVIEGDALTGYSRAIAIQAYLVEDGLTNEAVRINLANNHSDVRVVSVSFSEN